ncbi:MAG: putative manganese-dependent inorganic diphosphatase [Spirochaetaceae bacterium]|jgi:manganese-dependent inorganic pyrophosphatase|nr:putative manganese-dependent inorganic diphosphatase [Spirochaetaceae bacterium]
MTFTERDTMKKQVYIIGHKNPDADSVVSAAAYARLKQAQGLENYSAARAGNINPQTEYIFERFGMPVPEFLPDLVPKVAYYLSEAPVTVREDMPLWEALELMQNDSIKVLPIVNNGDSYRGLLHYDAFAKYIIAQVNPNKKSSIDTSIGLLIKTLRAQPLTTFNADELRRSSIVVAASYNTTFFEKLDSQLPENSLVIVGDRLDIQKYCVERRVRALVITNSTIVDKKLVALAEKNHVSVMLSPFDTASTSLLMIYSTPVGTMGDTTVPLARLGDTLKKIREPLSKAPSRCLPVADDEDRVMGIIYEGDILKEPNIEVIMVDHNEPSQAVEGIENYKIIEVIDHHRLGNLSTRYPITFINKAVGATSTIITNLYREQKVPLNRETASVLLCGILSDTLNLQSATTTGVDQEAAEYLSSITGLDIPELGRELLGVSGRINSKPAAELIGMDMKEYNEQGASFTVSQVETDTPEDLIARKDEILSALEKNYKEKNLLFSALMVTDVAVLSSFLFAAGKKQFIQRISFPKTEDGIYMLHDMVSRKKQLIPLLSELVEKAMEA